MTTECTDRRECYDNVRHCMKRMVSDFYRRNPAFLGDARSRSAIKESIAGLQCIFDELDKWEIRKKGGAADAP
jgi:hypothetical protein